ncbi:DUF4280 domain-containing protein [Pseudomonas aeruginosa]
MSGIRQKNSSQPHGERDGLVYPATTPSRSGGRHGLPAVCAGATLQCSFGAAPTVLNVLPQNRTLTSGMPAANIMDHIPLLNIPTFGLCQSPANPVVAAATAAALGVLTPMPCIPATASPWIPGGPPTLLLGGMPALDANGTLICTWGGVIKISVPGQVQMLIP